ncbi:MAG: hypothetical protein JWQ81_6066 [Amycolatopsis sp.]|nr:hypothetical protein [Amycolatopsis sp.]MCU1685327.1 hypothetical protein [Amycolatopsis sp.]
MPGALFYPLWLLLVGCLTLALPVAGVLALIGGVIVVLRTRVATR